MEFQKQCDDCLAIISAQQREADLQQKEVAVKKLKIGEEEAVCKKLAATAQADLDEAMPALEEAMRVGGKAPFLFISSFPVLLKIDSLFRPWMH